MATRPAKTGGAGATTYTGAVAAGAVTILAIDVDNDLNEIYTNITNTNIATGAAIATAKLATDSGIVTGMLANGAVTGPKLAVNSVGTSTLANGAVTQVKTAAGAANNTNTAAAFLTNINLSAGTELSLGQTASQTHRGGVVLISGTIGGRALLNDGDSFNLRIRLYNGAAGATLVTTWDAFASNGSTGGAVGIPVFIPIQYAIIATGANIWKVTGQQTGASGSPAFTSAAANAGALCVTELS